MLEHAIRRMQIQAFYQLNNLTKQATTLVELAEVQRATHFFNFKATLQRYHYTTITK